MISAPAAAAAASAPGEPWRILVKAWQKPSALRATWQLVATLGSYLALWCGIYLSLSVSWWLTIPLAMLAGVLLVRVFILFHDCCHGSFFRSRAANTWVGRVLGLLTWTPFAQWRMEHSIHHATSCNLNRRGVGDVWTMTVQEFLQASRWQRFAYRLARNPFVLFGVAPLVLFLFLERWPRRGARPREKYSVWLTNAAIAGMVLGLGSLFGFLPYLFIQLVVIGVAGAIGIWLFYLQHQFEGTYWAHGEDWDFVKAALQGSSFFRLPRLLQWLTGNIGFHHIHHLDARIPNYNLQRCHESNPLFQRVPTMTLLGSLRTLSLRLWDESSRKLVGFRHLRRLQRATVPQHPGKGPRESRRGR